MPISNSTNMPNHISNHMTNNETAPATFQN